MLKRAHKGTFHKLSAKHRQRYVNEFTGRHNIRELDTIRQMEHVVAEMVGKQLMYRDLIARVRDLWGIARRLCMLRDPPESNQIRYVGCPCIVYLWHRGLFGRHSHLDAG